MVSCPRQSTRPPKRPNLANMRRMSGGRWNITPSGHLAAFGTTLAPHGATHILLRSLEICLAGNPFRGDTRLLGDRGDVMERPGRSTRVLHELCYTAGSVPAPPGPSIQIPGRRSANNRTREGCKARAFIPRAYDCAATCGGYTSRRQPDCESPEQGSLGKPDASSS